MTSSVHTNSTGATTNDSCNGSSGTAVRHGRKTQRRNIHSLYILNIAPSNKSHKSASTITTTTKEFTMASCYFSAKLAPPILGAFVESVEERADGHAWFTIQIYPCHITIPGSDAMPIPRKSYCIYRRSEDVIGFVQQIEQEFPWLRSSIGIGRKLASIFSLPLRDRSRSRPSGALTIVPNPPSASKSAAPSCAAPSQLRLELDRFLQTFFVQEPLVRRCRLASEFFGIWKTDLEARLSQADRDPLALHSLMTHAYERNLEKRVVDDQQPSALTAAADALTNVDSDDDDDADSPLMTPELPNTSFGICSPGSSPCSSEPTTPTSVRKGSCRKEPPRSLWNIIAAASSRTTASATVYSPPGSSYHSEESDFDESDFDESDDTDDDLSDTSTANDESESEDDEEEEEISSKTPFQTIRRSVSFQALRQFAQRDFGVRPTGIAFSGYSSAATSKFNEGYKASEFSKSKSSYVSDDNGELKAARSASLSPETQSSSTSRGNITCVPVDQDCADHPHATVAAVTIKDPDVVSGHGSIQSTSLPSASPVLPAIRHQPSVIPPKPSSIKSSSSSFFSFVKALGSFESDTPISAAAATVRRASSWRSISSRSMTFRQEKSSHPSRCGNRISGSECPKDTLYSVAELETCLHKALFKDSHAIPDLTLDLAVAEVPPSTTTSRSKARVIQSTKSFLQSLPSAVHRLPRASTKLKRGAALSKNKAYQGIHSDEALMWASSGGHRRKRSENDHGYRHQQRLSRPPRNAQEVDRDPEHDHLHECKRERLVSPSLASITPLMVGCASEDVAGGIECSLSRSQSGYRVASEKCSCCTDLGRTKAFVATFKIILDSDRILALQVVEDEADFMLSVPDLRLRIQKKFERADMPLPEEFELMWTAWDGEEVVLKNDEELRRALAMSANRKVTLMCLVN